MPRCIVDCMPEGEPRQPVVDRCARNLACPVRDEARQEDLRGRYALLLWNSNRVTVLMEAQQPCTIVFAGIPLHALQDGQEEVLPRKFRNNATRGSTCGLNEWGTPTRDSFVSCNMWSKGRWCDLIFRSWFPWFSHSQGSRRRQQPHLAGRCGSSLPPAARAHTCERALPRLFARHPERGRGLAHTGARS